MSRGPAPRVGRASRPSGGIMKNALPVSGGSFRSHSGAPLAITTRSIRLIRRLNSALRVSMPDLRCE